jgi:sulfur-oxidizing protein SoxY
MLSRRDLFKVAGVGAATLMVAPGLVGQSFAAKKSLDDALKEKLGVTSKDLKSSELIKVKAPTIAESGANVPVEVSAKIPAQEVESLYIFIDKNPNPYVTQVDFSPMNGEVYFATRVKMGKTSPVRAVIKMKDGSLLTAFKEVKVTVGGCG